jgi:predicted aconitase with swiveling domain
VTTASGPDLRGRTLAPGRARGKVLVLAEPLSFWGGMDPDTGRIVDMRHPQTGASVAGAVVAMRSGRGSSSSSSVLAEAIRAGTAPAGVILVEPDVIVALGSIVAAELYGTEMPVVSVPSDSLAALHTGEPVEVRASPDGAEIRPV